MKPSKYTIHISIVAIVLGIALACYDLLVGPSKGDLDAHLDAIPADFQGTPIIVIDGVAIAPEIIAVWTKDFETTADTASWDARVKRLLQQEVLVRFAIEQGQVTKDMGMRDQVLYASYNQVFEKWSGVQPTDAQLEEYFEKNYANFIQNQIDLVRYSVPRELALSTYSSAEKFLQAIEQPEKLAMLSNDLVNIEQFKHQSLTNASAFAGIKGLNYNALIEQAVVGKLYGPFLDSNDIWYVFSIVHIRDIEPNSAEIIDDLTTDWQQQQAIDEMSALALELMDDADIQIIWQQ